ncbi:Magnesium transporter [Penicillium atrosanguineum]|uniref:Magnesium transporter n=1 Tax=Penicillium atrosanguineum TaxID=1132637 RepID=UPI00239CABEE|nr:Magnesium transporter [Penicillium atrosanguineum]KAJ5314102.1 Magnesium transporter [Penicillium atrosanguineum]
MFQVSDLVKDTKLPTKHDPEYTTHTFLESTSVSGRRGRRREREELWTKKRHLAIGIFGTVWLEVCASDGNRLRTVKEVRKIAPDSKTIDYSRELEAIAKFSQERFDGCFVRSAGWFEDPESLFICMEYLPLGDLQRYMKQPFPEQEAQQITLQLLEGLDFMHSNGFAHRDLKPQNIFVVSQGPDWWVKIGDYGISKRVLEGLTGLQTLNGTPAFTAPEVYQQIWTETEKKEELSLALEVDIWSLGAITYYMLTGKLPFQGQADLLAYYKEETSLPLKCVSQKNATPEALVFLENTLTASPAYRLRARELLDHAWLTPLLQESDAEEQINSPISHISPSDNPIIPQPLQIRIRHSPQEGMLPDTIDLPAIPSPNTLELSPSRTSQGIDCDTFKQIVAPATPLLSRNHPAMHPEIDTIPSPQPQSLCSESSTSPRDVRQPSQVSNTSTRDTMPPNTRRRSDAAPIPVSDLLYHTPKSGSAASSARNSTDRFEKFRRVSRDMVPRRSRRSQDHGKEQHEDEEKGLDIPKSPAWYVFKTDIDRSFTY